MRLSRRIAAIVQPVRRLVSTLRLLLFVILLWTSGNVSRAAPVTFRFDAEVTSIFATPSADIELPFDVLIGDTIRGQFTFEPAPIGQMGTQELGLQFEIGDVTLHSSTYEIIIALNQFPPLGSPTFEPFDIISVGCSSVGDADCIPKSVPGSNSIEWRPLMQLSAVSPTLNSIELISDPAIWNMLDHRSLQLSSTLR